MICSIINVSKKTNKNIMQSQVQYNTILALCKSNAPKIFNSSGNLSHRGCQPLLPDIEVIALSIYQAFSEISSECLFYAELCQQLPDVALKLGCRKNYNTRKRKLSPYIEPIRENIVRLMCPSPDGEIMVVDSMPIEVCRYSRANTCAILKDDEDSAPQFGYCASQEQKYFGYKLNCVCTTSGLIYCYDLSQAHHHDIKYLHDVQDKIKNCYLIGDKGYRSSEWRNTLFEYAGIELATPCKKNELLQYEMPEDYMRLRKRIEVVFSQLVDQCRIRKNYAKSQCGFFTNIISKITLFTILQYINHVNKRSFFTSSIHVNICLMSLIIPTRYLVCYRCFTSKSHTRIQRYWT